MSPGARPAPWMHSREPIIADVSTWIDVSVLNAELSGVLLLLAALWGLVLFNRLWQHSLGRDAAEAIASARTLGLAVGPAPLRARWVASGNIGSQPVELSWRGGIWGAHSVVRLGGRSQNIPLVRTTDQLNAALSGQAEAPTT